MLSFVYEPEEVLVFDLVGGDAGFQCERDFPSFVHPKLDDPEEAVGLIGREES